MTSEAVLTYSENIDKCHVSANDYQVQHIGIFQLIERRLKNK